MAKRLLGPAEKGTNARLGVRLVSGAAAAAAGVEVVRLVAGAGVVRLDGMGAAVVP